MRTVTHILVHYFEQSGDQATAPLCDFKERVSFEAAPDLKIRCPKCRRKCA
jgi:hypothetical protein